jgi:uncharacterized protein (TIGR02145 family)
MKRAASLILVFFFLFFLSSHSESQDKKKTVAVLEFNSTSKQIGSDELATLGSRFRTMLVKTGTFDVLERQKMSDILNEQNFILSDNCNSAECAVQVGQLLGVEFMIAGDIGKLGTIYSVDLRLIDVSTGKIVQSESEDHQGDIGGLLSRMAAIANSFAGIKNSLVTKSENADTFTDPRDGKKYKFVKIGNQIWMGENLNYETSSGSFCYDNNFLNCSTHGRLYDWENAKKVAPPGWHLPSIKEWESLVDYLGGFNEKTISRLISDGDSGVNILLTGWRGSLGNYEGVGTYAGLWSWCDDGTNLGWALHLSTENQSISLSEDGNEYSSYYIRCIKD